MAKLAEEAGVTDAYIAQLETGSERTQHSAILKRLARAVGLTLRRPFDVTGDRRNAFDSRGSDRHARQRFARCSPEGGLAERARRIHSDNTGRYDDRRNPRESQQLFLSPADATPESTREATDRDALRHRRSSGVRL